MARQLTRRERRFLILCFLTVLAFASWKLVVTPFKEKNLALDNELEEKRKLLSKNTRLVRKADFTEKEYQAYFKKFQQTKTDDQVMSSMIAEIEKVAADLSLQISDLKPKRGKSGDYYSRFSVSLTMDSDLSEIVHFLYILQQEPYLYNVDEFRFDKGAQRKSSTIKSQIVLSKTLVPSE